MGGMLGSRAGRGRRPAQELQRAYGAPSFRWPKSATGLTFPQWAQNCRPFGTRGDEVVRFFLARARGILRGLGRPKKSPALTSF